MLDIWVEEGMNSGKPFDDDKEIAFHFMDFLFASQDASTSSIVWTIAVLGNVTLNSQFFYYFFIIFFIFFLYLFTIYYYFNFLLFLFIILFFIIFIIIFYLLHIFLY